MDCLRSGPKIEADRRLSRRKSAGDLKRPRAREDPPERPSPIPRGRWTTWLEGLSPTALNLLEAARRILLAEGYAGVTLEAVALEAGEDKATIKRHFGSKAGLIHALFDQLGDDILDEVNRPHGRAAGRPAAHPRDDPPARRPGPRPRDRARHVRAGAPRPA